MNLFNPMTTIGKMTKPFEHPYKGTVVQVENDPEYIGRIKVDIPELYGEFQEGMEGILPWIYPRYFGKFAGKLEFSVPEKGDKVEIEFPYKNPYVGYYTNKPMYTDVWETLIAIDPEEGQAIVDRFKNHYPNVYGHLDKNLTGWYVDKVTNEIFLVQGGKKANISLNAEGSLIVNSPKDMIFTAGNRIMFTAGTSFAVKAATIDTEATVNHTGTVNSSGEGTFNNVTVSGHLHKYEKPVHGAGPTDSDPPTSGT